MAEKVTDIPKRADECPYWRWETTDVWGIARGHCDAPGGSNDVDGSDPCCGAGFHSEDISSQLVEQNSTDDPQPNSRMAK